MKTRVLLAGVAALLMATSAAHARPELSKTQSWKLTQGTWCMGDQPSDNEAYVGIARDKCGEDEKTLIIRENGYLWEREDGLSCRYYPAGLVLTTLLLHQPKQLACGFFTLLRVVSGDPHRVRLGNIRRASTCTFPREL